MTDYHNFTTQDMPEAERRQYSVGDIWINAAKCEECSDVIRSTNRHDYVTCSCGNLSVDGGSWYVKRSAKDITKVTEMVELFYDVCG